MTNVFSDMREKDLNRPLKVDAETCELVREHIHSYPTRNSHYSPKDNDNHNYFMEKHDLEYLKLQQENVQHKIVCHFLTLMM